MYKRIAIFTVETVVALAGAAIVFKTCIEHANLKDTKSTPVTDIPDEELDCPEAEDIE